MFEVKAQATLKRETRIKPMSAPEASDRTLAPILLRPALDEQLAEMKRC